MDSVSEQESDLSQNNLDDEFRNILSALKPYILSINNNDHLTQIRLWLEKLSGTESNEKFERNKYLTEFAHQIRSGILKTPFTRIPPPGNLLPLSATPSDEDSASSFSHAENMIWDLSNQCFENSSSTYSNDQQIVSSSWPQLPMTQYYISPQTPRSDQNFTGRNLWMQDSHGYYYYPPSQNMRLRLHQMVNNNRRLKRRPRTPSRCYRRAPILKQSPNENYCLQHFLEEPVQEDSAEDQNTEMKEQNQNCASGNVMICEGPSNNSHEGETTEVTELIEQSPEEDSSWCDLTDASVTSVSLMASGDADKGAIQQQETEITKNERMKEYENRISNMMDKIQGLQQKNEELNHHVEQCKKHHSPADSRHCHGKLNGELQAFKDLIEMKSAIKNTNFIATDWKKNWNILQSRLAETIQQNSELNLIIRKLEKKLNEVENAKIEEKNEFKRKLNELHNKEIEMLKQLQIENLRNIDVAHKRKLETVEHDYQKRIQELQNNFDTRIREMKELHEKELKEKQAEIERLDGIAKKECVRISSEVSSLKSQIEGSNFISNTDERVVFLHKCISKMDKLFRKSEKEYIRQIEKLKHEIEMKEKSLQIQLRTQKAELLAIATEEKQAYLDDIIKDLEERYIRFLEAQEKQAYENRKKDEQIIADLKQLLEENGISYSV